MPVPPPPPKKKNTQREEANHQGFLFTILEVRCARILGKVMTRLTTTFLTQQDNLTFTALRWSYQHTV